MDRVSFERYHDSYGFTLPEATRLQRNIWNHYKNGEEVVNDTQFSCNGSVDENSEYNRKSLDICSKKNRDEVRKSLVTCVDTFLSSERVSNEMADKFHEEVQNIYKQKMSKLK